MSFNRNLTSLIIAGMLLIIGFAPAVDVAAQDNLLTNPGFNQEGSYRDYRPAGSTYSFAFAPGWAGWQTLSPRTESWMNIEPIAFPHTSYNKYEGTASQNIGRGGGTFTAAAYQTVNNIPEGAILEFSVWVFQENNSRSNARTRVGIGSNTGGNPLASNITWSDWNTALRSWQRMDIRATVPAGSVTVFIYSTQTYPNDPNQVYYDNAELKALGSGEPNVGSGADTDGDGEPDPTAIPTNTPQPFAAFVAPQGGDDTGRIEHVVQSGDTLAAISVAYGVPLSEILELNGLERGAFLQVGQSILIDEGGDLPTAEPTLAPMTATPRDDEGGDDADAQDAGTGGSGGFASPTPQEVAAQATAVPTDEPEDEPTDEPTDEPEEEPTEAEPTEIPTETPVPPTATDAPPAPVETGSDSDPLAVEAAICVLMFNDANQNNIRDGDEVLLNNGLITLEAAGLTEPQTYTTNGNDEPYCFSDIETGSYVVSAVAPEGFGLRRDSLLANVPPGQQFLVRFAAVEGLEVTSVPTTAPSSSVTDADPEIIEEDADDPIRNLRNIAGIIVFALAGVVLIGGVGAAVVASRR